MIRIGIICPSEIAFRRFLPSLKKTADFQYVGVAVATREEFVGASDEILAKEREKAQSFVENHGGKIFEGYSTIIRSDEIDALYVPLPPALHCKWAKMALENGKHVMVEKPSTTCLADTQALVSLAAEKKLALHENYMFVFHKQMAAIDKIVKSGEIGDVRLYRISFGFPRRDARDFRYNKALGGGALLDAGGYTMKLATELLVGDVRLKAASAGYVAFGMDNDYRCELEIWGSKGTLTTGRILTAPNGYEPCYTIKKNQEFTEGKLPADDAFLGSIQRFGACMADDEVRKDNYEKLLRQERLVEEFKNQSGML